MSDLSPEAQAAYHVGCVFRHAGKAVAALWTRAWFRSVVLCVWAVILFTLAGCKTAPSHVDGAPSPSAAAEQVRASERRQIAARDSLTVSSLREIAGRAAAMGEVALRQYLAAEVGIMLQRYAEVAPLIEHVTAAQARAEAWASGNTQQAEAATAAAMVDAKTFADALATERAARIAAEAREVESRRASERAIADLQRQIQEERERQRMEQISMLNRAGFWCEAAAAALVGLGFLFGGIASIRKTGPAALMIAVIGLFAFGLAQIVGAWWFKWAILGCVVVIVVWVAVWVYRHYQQGDLKEQAEARAAKVSQALKAVVPVVDEVYDNGTDTLKDLYDKGIKTVRDLLDSTLFSKLSDVMNRVPGTKATIHEIRAETKSVQ